MNGKKLLTVGFLLACITPVARAQKGFEITPFGGSRFGGIIDETSSNTNTTFDYLTIKSSVNYGAIFDYHLWDNFEPEFMWNRQPTELAGHVPATGGRMDLTSANLDMYQFGFLYSFRRPEAKLKPFFVGGLGFTHFGSNGTLDFSNRLSYNMGIGAKYFFNKYVGLRLEGRWAPSRTTTSPTEYCDPFSGFCYAATAANHAEQGEANLGLVIRFK